MNEDDVVDIDFSDVDNFNPRKSDRPPRCIGFAEETEYIVTYLRDRGDQRIGQYIINAIRFETDAKTGEEIESRLWNVEADELLELIKEYESKDEEKPDIDTDCVVCGDGVDSADELQNILEEKGGE